MNETSFVVAKGLPVPGENSRSEEHTSELQSPCNLVCRLLLEKICLSPPQREPRRRSSGPNQVSPLSCPTGTALVQRLGHGIIRFDPANPLFLMAAGPPGLYPLPKLPALRI